MKIVQGNHLLQQIHITHEILIPSYIDLLGNEEADTTAKGLRKPLIQMQHIIKLTNGDLRNLAKKIFELEWETR